MNVVEGTKATASTTCSHEILFNKSSGATFARNELEPYLLP